MALGDLPWCRGDLIAMISAPSGQNAEGDSASMCLDCRHQVEPDPAEMAERHGAEMSVLDWHARLVCSRCGRRRVDMVVTGIEPREARMPHVACYH